jgi:hypothetical protein
VCVQESSSGTPACCAACNHGRHQVASSLRRIDPHRSECDVGARQHCVPEAGLPRRPAPDELVTGLLENLVASSGHSAERPWRPMQRDDGIAGDELDWGEEGPCTAAGRSYRRGLVDAGVGRGHRRLSALSHVACRLAKRLGIWNCGSWMPAC